MNGRQPVPTADVSFPAWKADGANVYSAQSPESPASWQSVSSRAVCARFQVMVAISKLAKAMATPRGAQDGVAVVLCQSAVP